MPGSVISPASVTRPIFSDDRAAGGGDEVATAEGDEVGFGGGDQVAAGEGAAVGLPPPAQAASTRTTVSAPVRNASVGRNIWAASLLEGRPKRKDSRLRAARLNDVRGTRKDLNAPPAGKKSGVPTHEPSGA